MTVQRNFQSRQNSVLFQNLYFQKVETKNLPILFQICLYFRNLLHNTYSIIQKIYDRHKIALRMLITLTPAWSDPSDGRRWVLWGRCNDPICRDFRLYYFVRLFLRPTIRLFCSPFKVRLHVIGCINHEIVLLLFFPTPFRTWDPFNVRSSEYHHLYRAPYSRSSSSFCRQHWVNAVHLTRTFCSLLKVRHVNGCINLVD